MHPSVSDEQHLFFEGVSRPRAQPRLRQSVHHQAAASEEIQPNPLIPWIFEKSGLSASAYRTRSLMRRLPACLRALGAATTDEARIILERAPALIPLAFQTLLLGVTSFCRDEHVFSQLQQQVIPELAKADRPLRIWSAACADGQELYSIAILLEQAGCLDGSRLLGTDIRHDAIERARCGAYSAEAISRLPPDVAEQYFAHNDADWRISNRLAHATEWKVSDILREPESGPWHMILWRNMAVYLTLTVAEQVWVSIYNGLRPGGFLVSGKADHPRIDQPLERLGNCIYRKPDKV